MKNHDDEPGPARKDEQRSMEMIFVESMAKDEDIQCAIIPPFVCGIETVASDAADIEFGSPTIRAATISSLPVQVPRSQRRGLCGRFTILAEVNEPLDYPDGTKWFITSILAMAAVTAPLGSTIIFPTLHHITEDFHTTGKITNLSVALYMLGMAVFPLWWSSFSETLGRRTIYLVSFTLFVVLNVFSAVSTGVIMLIVLRLLGGGASASVQAVGAGTIADIWGVKVRGRAMGIFWLGPLMAPLLGPMIGGALAEKFGWRSTQWFLAIYGFFLVLIIFFALPETRKDVKSVMEEVRSESLIDVRRTSTGRSVQEKTKQRVKMIKRIFIDPLKIVIYLRFPAMLLTIIYASTTFWALYLLNISIEMTFSRAPYNFSTIGVGLAYLPGSLGFCFASICCSGWADTIMIREAETAMRRAGSNTIKFRPEDRLGENTWFAAFLYPAALIWYGWTAEKGYFWPVPLVANFFFGIGSMLILGTIITMLTEFMPGSASAGVALHNCVRNIMGAVGVMVAEPLLKALGNGWLFTGVAGLTAGGGVIIWAVKRFGARWRVEMDSRVG